MNLALKIFCALLLVTIVSLYANEREIMNDADTIVYRRQLTDSTQEQLCFIGEVRNKSYVKVRLFPVEVSSVYEGEEAAVLKYKGSYYESVSGRKYVIFAEFEPESRVWTFRCFNSNNQPVFLFSGKQNTDGSIEGTWRSKKNVHPFYLKPA